MCAHEKACVDRINSEIDKSADECNTYKAAREQDGAVFAEVIKPKIKLYKPLPYRIFRTLNDCRLLLHKCSDICTPNTKLMLWLNYRWLKSTGQTEAPSSFYPHQRMHMNAMLAKFVASNLYAHLEIMKKHSHFHGITTIKNLPASLWQCFHHADSNGIYHLSTVYLTQHR